MAMCRKIDISVNVLQGRSNWCAKISAQMDKGKADGRILC